MKNVLSLHAPLMGAFDSLSDNPGLGHHQERPLQTTMKLLTFRQEWVFCRALWARKSPWRRVLRAASLARAATEKLAASNPVLAFAGQNSMIGSGLIIC
jgi:hypothetical protein